MIIHFGRKKRSILDHLLFPLILIFYGNLFWLPSIWAATDCSNVAVTTIPKEECDTLVALYNSTGGPNWSDRDCQNIPGGSLFRRVNWEDFTLSTDLQYLQPTVENFRLIWSREPITVSGGFIPASMFSTYWTDTEQCDPIETPLECEFRQNNASIVLISIGSDQKPGTEEDFDRYMRRIVDYSIERNVLPVLATDAYGAEEDFPLNQIMAQIAYDYDIPLWNFWAAVQDLPNHGLKEDNFHISAKAFTIKRITGLQVLHAVLTAPQE